MKQVVQAPTRLDPPRMMNPIHTTLSKYYQVPDCQKTLGADTDTGEAASDHLCVKFTPLTVINNKPAQKKRTVKVWSMPEYKYLHYEAWLKEQTWESVTSAETVHEKTEVLQSMSLEAMEKFFPEKNVTFSSEPWIDSKIKREIRKRKGIYSRHRKNIAWEKQNQVVSELINGILNLKE